MTRHMRLALREMKSIQIRNVPEDIHRTLRSRAAALGLSLSDYLLEEIGRVAGRPAVADVLSRASGRAGGVAGGRIVAEIRAERDGR